MSVGNFGSCRCEDGDVDDGKGRKKKEEKKEKDIEGE